MSPPRTWSDDPDRELPAIELPSWAVKGDSCAALGTPRLLWVQTAGRVTRLAIPGPWTVLATGRGIAAWCAAADVWVDAEGIDLNDDPRIRRGWDLSVQRAPGGPWTCEGVALPEGARWSRDLRPAAEGRILTWSDSGYLYTWDLVSPPTPRPIPGPEQGPVHASPPDDAVTGPVRIAGLRVVATRLEGHRIRGWLRDGTQVVDYASSGSS